VKDHSNLAERLDIFKEGTMWKHFSASNINPLSNLNTFLVFQQEIEHERVFCQGIWLYIPGL
jgi:hypothetical protein